MRATTTFFSILAVCMVLGSGCTGPQKKLGRGINNATEITRLGEMQRAMEQTYLWDGSERAYTLGSVRGVSKTVARTAVGIYEIVTFPFPSYDPVCQPYLSPKPRFPDNYKPAVLADPVFSSDVYLGSGSNADVMPFIPGSRFRIFTD
jgi:putative exosortase-associated protein (TIGR04073 family)